MRKISKNRCFPWNGMQAILIGFVLISCAWGVLPENADLPGTAGQSMEIYLLIGQSNMAGRGTVEEQDQIPNPSVLTFTKENKWILAVDPIHFDKSMAGVGPGRTSGIEMAGHNPAVTIGLVPCAVRGTSILVWKPGAYDEKTDTLLGKKRGAEQIELLSNASQVSTQTPPAFLVHAGDDNIVPVSHSMDYYLALRKANVPAELHIFEKGGHGFGLGQSLPPVKTWPGLCEQWMKQMELFNFK